ncbi:hypothetical protein EON63_16215 [archaeon]|nr:MAG: hypothetical protein EON63_16215 [archaeon]
MEKMWKVVHKDLVYGKKLNYQSAAGLYDLYLRSQGKAFLKEMMQIVITGAALESSMEDNEGKKDQFDENALQASPMLNKSQMVSIKRKILVDNNPHHVDNNPLLI